jgi:hypothetical protein
MGDPMVASSSVSSGRIGKILEEVPSFAPAYRTLAACYGHLGRLDEAQSIIKRLATLTPVVVPTTNPFRHPEPGELFLSGLRLAAGEAT